ncbi:hypothetical protein [uncultured Mediterranean phage uvMED]|nr:hypothetical protein [uncultured Mediterranean phage uvMED]
MDKKIQKLIEEILQRIEVLEEIAVNNNNLLGYIISGSKPAPISTNELKSIYLTGEMIEYVQENNIPMDFIADA